MAIVLGDTDEHVGTRSCRSRVEVDQVIAAIGPGNMDLDRSVVGAEDIGSLPSRDVGLAIGHVLDIDLRLTLRLAPEYIGPIGIGVGVNGL